jgi:hypothetical protein
MIKKLIKVFATKLYDIAISIAAFLTSKVLKNIDKVSVLGIIIIILQQFAQSKIYKIVIIFYKMLYAILSTYSIILTFTPYYSHIEILNYLVNYTIDSVSYYKNNFIEAYDILMHGQKSELIINNDEIKDPFSHYNDKKTYNLGQESDNSSWYNNVYFKTIVGLSVGALTGYVLYYYGYDIYDYIISNLTNRDPGSGSNPDGSSGSSSLSSSNNKGNLQPILNGKSRELPNFQMGSGFISTFTESIIQPRRLNTYDMLVPKPSDRLASGYETVILPAKESVTPFLLILLIQHHH